MAQGAAGRLKGLQEERNKRLNIPKTGQINELFHQALGLRDISKSWNWAGMSVARATKKLDDHVTSRGLSPTEDRVPPACARCTLTTTTTT